MTQQLMLDFQTWQKWECNRLDITIEDHSKILEISKEIETAGLGCPYDVITQLIKPQAHNLKVSFAEFGMLVG